MKKIDTFEEKDEETGKDKTVTREIKDYSIA